ncbi:MAG: hypothetical protein PHT40_01730 [Patescibacteria group bacterium]|nr:hypothetical protein [Patescibacteria group bacterium]
MGGICWVAAIILATFIAICGAFMKASPSPTWVFLIIVCGLLFVAVIVEGICQAIRRN